MRYSEIFVLGSMAHECCHLRLSQPGVLGSVGQLCVRHCKSRPDKCGNVPSSLPLPGMFSLHFTVSPHHGLPCLMGTTPARTLTLPALQPLASISQCYRPHLGELR